MLVVCPVKGFRSLSFDSRRFGIPGRRPSIDLRSYFLRNMSPRPFEDTHDLYYVNQARKSMDEKLTWGPRMH